MQFGEQSKGKPLISYRRAVSPHLRPLAPPKSVIGDRCRAKISDLSKKTLGIKNMDVEHINAVGNALADLSQRTIDLRGYL